MDKSDDPINDGAEALYTIRILNPLDKAATKLALTVTVPEELQIGDDLRGPTQGEKNLRTVRFQPLPALAASQIATYSIPVKALSPGAVRLKVELTADSLPAGAVITQEENLTVVQSK